MLDGRAYAVELYGLPMRAPQRPRSEEGAPATATTSVATARQEPPPGGGRESVRTRGTPIENLGHTIKCRGAGTMGVGE